MIPVTARRAPSTVSRREYKGSERGIEEGARGINKGKKRARGLRHAHRQPVYVYIIIIGMNVDVNLNSV
jgi:hypothetical protein